MLHADLDDEQRAHLTHGHPDGLDSSPSPLSSRTLTYFDSLRSTSPLHQRSHTTTHGSSHLLARLISLEEEVREINTATVVTTQHLEAEKTRANVAERRALHRLRMATESRERAEQESARLREALKLCKLKLENAQTEIFQAQDVIDQVTFQRIDAEAEVGRAGTEARKLEEETRTLVMLAREEGRRMGFQERLSVGRRISYDKGGGR
ncbi:hypothetical protein OG21DRAFT_902109 [Imleria badia]|nr:hypothetical protein OG21DRAFT_902109 [Imleria badia]